MANAESVKESRELAIQEVEETGSFEEAMQFMRNLHAFMCVEEALIEAMSETIKELKQEKL